MRLLERGRAGKGVRDTVPAVGTISTASLHGYWNVSAIVEQWLPSFRWRKTFLLLQAIRSIHIIYVYHIFVACCCHQFTSMKLLSVVSARNISPNKWDKHTLFLESKMCPISDFLSFVLLLIQISNYIIILNFVIIMTRFLLFLEKEREVVKW